MQMAGETSDVIKLHDDTIADKLSEMKIFYRHRLLNLEHRNMALEQELAKYTQKTEE